MTVPHRQLRAIEQEAAASVSHDQRLPEGATPRALRGNTHTRPPGPPSKNSSNVRDDFFIIPLPHKMSCV